MLHFSVFSARRSVAMITRLTARVGAFLLIAVAAASAAPSSSDASMLGRTFASVLPGDSDDEVAFISIGDWGCGAHSQAQVQVARQMQVYAEKFNVSFFVSLGDQFYPTVC
jgi:hypothetical protein